MISENAIKKGVGGGGRIMGFVLIALLAFPAMAAEKEHLRVGGDAAYPPFEYLNQEGKPIGFNCDIFSALSAAMGFEFELQLGLWQEVRNDLETGRIDVLMGMFYSEARDKKVDFSVPHCLVSYALFIPEGSPLRSLEDCRGKRILVQTGDYGHDFVLEERTSERIETRPTMRMVLESLRKGEGDCAILSRFQGIHLLEEHEIPGIEVVGVALFQRKYCLAVREGDTALLAKLNEGLAILRETGEYDRIYEKWFGPYDDRRFDWGEALQYLGWIFFVLGLLVLIFFAWTWRLRVEVAAKTAIIQRELEERRRAEEALRESEARFRQIFEAGPQGVVIVGRDSGEIVDANAAFLELSGYQEKDLLGKSLPEIGCLPGADHDLSSLLKLVDDKQPPMLNARLLSTDGRQHEVLLFVSGMTVLGAACLILVVIDITEQQRLEEQLRHAQKMEAVGQLAGGVAHDLNNLLQAMLGYADLALQDCAGEGAASDSIREIQAAGERAGALIRQLLAFSRREATQPRTIELNQLLQDLMKMVHRVIGEHIELNFMPTPELCPIYADPGQLEQIVVNLCVNARDAMEAGGRLSIMTQRHDFDAAFCAHHPEFSPGEYVCLTVRDQGKGMDKAIQERIFEPFFTTKEVGKGTGIGLATVYAIVERYAGHITVESAPGAGALFSLYFPVSEGELILNSTEEDDTITEEGSGVILFAEDESAVRKLVLRILQRAGYQVYPACDGEEAWRLFEAHEAEIDLALLDVVMPKLDGVQLRERIQARRSDLPVLLSSGYSNELLSKQARFEPVPDQLLRKPYSAKSLLARIRSLMRA